LTVWISTVRVSEFEPLPDSAHDAVGDEGPDVRRGGTGSGARSHHGRQARALSLPGLHLAHTRRRRRSGSSRSPIPAEGGRLDGSAFAETAGRRLSRLGNGRPRADARAVRATPPGAHRRLAGGPCSPAGAAVTEVDRRPSHAFLHRPRRRPRRVRLDARPPRRPPADSVGHQRGGGPLTEAVCLRRFRRVVVAARTACLSLLRDLVAEQRVPRLNRHPGVCLEGEELPT
jgi:hypothetical protein